MNIAIDGPAGAGKSTIARRLAKETGFIYVDTGAMYRAMALYFLEQGIDPGNESLISAAGEDAEISIRYQDGEQQVMLNGENVNGKIRSEKVGNIASVISVYPKIRQKLVSLQQKLAKHSDVVMDGRDIGTCVLPNAEVKIYLTASSLTRAKRRHAQLLEKGEEKSIKDIQKDIEERDYRDTHREISPLRQATGAVLVDSSNLSVEEVIDAIKKIYQEKQ